jgi:hypothetical protein
MATDDHHALDVDEEGRPEGPAQVAMDKRKKRNLTYVGLALGALGIVVVVIYQRRAAASQAGTSQNTYAYPQLPPGTQAGIDTTAGTSGVEGDALSSLLAQLSAQETANTAALAGLQNSINGVVSEVNGTKGHGGHFIGRNPDANTRNQSPPPKLNPHNYPTVYSGAIQRLGTAGSYSNIHVTPGTPLYFDVGGKWTQYLNPKSLPGSTPVGTIPGLP